MLLNVVKSSFLAALRFSRFWPWDVDNDRGIWLWWCLHTNGWGLYRSLACMCARLTFPFLSRIFPSDWEGGVLGVDC